MNIMILITGFKDLSYQADLKSSSCQEETIFNQTGSSQIKSSEMIEWPLKNWITWGKNSLSRLENEQAKPLHNFSAPAVLTRICNLHNLICFSTLQLLVKVKRKRKAKILLKPTWRQRNKRRKERRNFLMVMSCKRKRNTRN